MNKVICVIIFSYSLLSFSQKLPADYDEYLDNYRTPREYFVHCINSTKSFYILNTTVEKKPAILVIYKGSPQLEKLTIKANLVYSFRTYRHNDITSAGYEICNYVEEKLVWCAESYYKNNLDLHFTDSMGNETFEEDD